jgi:hypothetical protein
VLSINADDDGYQTPSPESDSQSESASPELNEACSPKEFDRIDRTPRAPSLRSIAAPLHQSIPDCGLTPKSKLDHTFSHLRLCFNSESDATETSLFLPASGQTPTTASAQATPTKNRNKVCLIQ